MTPSKKELLDIFAKITGIVPRSTSALKGDCVYFRVLKSDGRMRAFVATLEPDAVKCTLYGIKFVSCPRALMHDFAFRIPIRRLIEANETLPPYEPPEKPLHLDKMYKKGKLDGLLKAESMIKNLSVRDLTNIMRGEAADRVRLYGVNETIRILTKKIEAIKKSL